MKKIVIVILIGITLVAGVVATGTYGLSKDNTTIYEQAVALETENINFGFDGFSFTDYPVAFYDGDNDYVVIWEDGDYSINKRTAIINFIAATAYPVDEHYEVLTPTIEKMSSLITLMGGGSTNYGANEHIATLWHEAFHCWQLTNFLDNIENICPMAVDESMITKYADTNEQAIELFKQQTELLEKAVKSEDIYKINECIVKYKELDEERKVLLPDEVNALEDYYTRVEGTACYIESYVYKLQLPENFDSNYIDTISEYKGGSGKYYKTGMAMCMILDTLNPDWKHNYDFSEPLINLIYTELEN